jgi:parallel beta-helix repeat protein
MIIRNYFHDNNGNGINIDANSNGVYSENEFSYHSTPVIVSKNLSNPIIENNLLKNNSQYGIWIKSSGKGFVKYNTMINHSNFAISVEKGCFPIIENNEFLYNKGTVKNNN